MLHLFHNTKQIFIESFQYAYMDMEFSVNLTIGIKWEPQSLPWSKKQVTVHLRTTKTYYGKKVYHPYMSDSREHNQAFVNFAINTMLSATDLQDVKQILIKSDNCSGQYKSAEHFYDLHNNANQENKSDKVLWGRSRKREG